MVKARYRRWFLRWLIDRDHYATARRNPNRPLAPEDSDPEDVMPPVEAETHLHRIKPTNRRGIRHLSAIWQAVQPQHITNCWCHSDIIPGQWVDVTDARAPSLEHVYEALQPLLEALHPQREGRLNCVEFVHDVAGKCERACEFR